MVHHELVLTGDINFLGVTDPSVPFAGADLMPGHGPHFPLAIERYTL